MEENFSKTDINFIKNYGISLRQIEQQIEIFKNGVSKTILERPALINDGIRALNQDESLFYAHFFDSKKENLKLEKFVPASGAASRMFQFLTEFFNTFDLENETINGYINKNNANSFNVFIAGMEKFPFFETIHNKLKETYPDFSSWNRDHKNYYFIKFLIGSEYLDFASKPKGVLPFHDYKNRITTPIEEHLKESIYYASSNRISNLHFTISEEHQKDFEVVLSNLKEKIETENNATININFSYQHKKTDTIAVDLKNNPLRDSNGNLIFRPGGHGALIENLNNLDSDIIFIKNIDNVIKNNIETIGLYKKALAGILIETQEEVFSVLRNIENKFIAEKELDLIVLFAKNKLNITIIPEFYLLTFQNKIDYLKTILNKPIRVCGMVKNENEPGGGPFWIVDKFGNKSLQIVESSQIDLLDKGQVAILNAATHFNPVDIVCSTKNYLSTKFDLHLFVDHNSGFIVQKNKNGQDLKSYELPGLWNGAMANWLTIFVEVPLITFNPVKTVNDLLKPAHQE